MADIKKMLSEARGGWKMLMMVGGLSAAGGAVVAKVLGWIGILPR